MQSAAARASQFAAAPAPRAQYGPVAKALYIQSVEDAASIAGGYERLAAELGVSVDQVRSWSSGASIPECALFLRVIEILLGPALASDAVPQPPPEPESGGFTAAPEAG